MVDLRAKPYNLCDEDIAWVENTIASMTAEEKVGQLFWQLTASQEEDYLQELMEKYHLGGCRYNGMPGAKVLAQNRTRIGIDLTTAEIAAAGVYLHAKAGDLTAEELGEYGILASDLIERIPLVCKDLSDSRTRLSI